MSETCFPTFAASAWACDLSSARRWVLHLEAGDAKKQGRWKHCEGCWQSSTAGVRIKAALPTGMSGTQRWQRRRRKLWHLMVSGWTCWDDSVRGAGVQSWLFYLPSLCYSQTFSKPSSANNSVSYPNIKYFYCKIQAEMISVVCKLEPLVNTKRLG